MIKSSEQALPEEINLKFNRVPPKPQHIHLMGICGTGMAALAGLLMNSGYRVSGSDENVYPPMSDFLASLSIPIHRGYQPGNLSPPPDLVVVGNVITSDNPEAIELARRRLPFISLPQALRHFALRDKQTIVVSGTHGKTTTAALIASILEQAHLDPGFMIGGLPNDFASNFKLGSGLYFIVEGDEYDTAFFDKRPKFIHYGPWATVLTSIEFDHADIYRDLDEITTNFEKLTSLTTAKGLLVANGDDPLVVGLAKKSGRPFLFYGFSANCLWRATDISIDETSTALTIRKAGQEYLRAETPLYGRHNIANLLAAAAVADFVGIPVPSVAEALKAFKGVLRRQSIMGEKCGILVVDDFAHHPTAVRETITAVRDKYKTRRLIAVFEPRSNSSRRNVFQQPYALAFDQADLVMIPEPQSMEKIPLQERFSSSQLAGELRQRGLQAFYFPTTSDLLEVLLTISHPGDIVLFMSNGAFDNLPQRFLQEIASNRKQSV